MRVLTTAVWERLQPLVEAGVVVWCVTIEVDVGPPSRALHLCGNTRGINLNGRAYRPWPISVGEIPEAGRGDLEECQITMANIWRIAMPFLESGTWDQGRCELTLALKAPDGTSWVDSGIRFSFKMQALTANDEKITATAGQPNWVDTPLPWERWIRGDKFPAMPRNQ